MGIKYATREQVKNSLEIAYTSRSDSLIDQKIDAASRSVEGLLHRRFYPERRTVKFDWPNRSYAPTWQIWLDDNEMISIESVTSGGTLLDPTYTFLSRGDDKLEPPYSALNIDLSTAGAFSGGVTFQRAIESLGLYGYNDTDVSIPSGTLGGNINAVVTTLIINPSSGMYTVGVGSVVLIGTERLILVERRMSTSGQTLQGALDDMNSDTTVAVTDGTLFAQYETILIDAERMRIVDIAGNNLIVQRAWDGSVVGTHLVGATIFAQRTFTAKRGALGSTAAAHNLADSVYAHEYPGLVNELCIAETVVLLEQNSSAYARTIGSGPNVREATGNGLEDLRAQAYTAYGRKQRSTAI